MSYKCTDTYKQVHCAQKFPNILLLKTKEPKIALMLFIIIKQTLKY